MKKNRKLGEDREYRRELIKGILFVYAGIPALFWLMYVVIPNMVKSCQ